MYENINYLPVEELDDNLIDYLKSSLNQSATLNKTTWEKVYTDLAEIEGWCHTVQPVPETSSPYAF